MKNLILLALIAGSVTASSALTQTTNPGSDTRAKASDQSRRDDIVVTGRNMVVGDSSAATKSRALILSTPQAISVVDSDFYDTLKRLGIGV